MTEKAIDVRKEPGSPLAAASSSSAAMENVIAGIGRAREFVKRHFKPGVHFGTPFGGEDREDGKGKQQGGDYKKKQMLYQPGADLLLKFHGYSCSAKALEANCVRDWKAPFFAFEYEASIVDNGTGEVIGNGFGAANSMEPAFAGRWVAENKVPREMEKDQLRFSERASKYKQGETYKVYWLPVPPEEKFGQMNSVMKRAIKRAKVAAAIQACAIAADFVVGDDDDDDQDPEGQQHAASGAKPASGAVDLISDAQRKRFYAIAKSEGKHSDDAIKAYLVKTFKSEHSKDIPRAQYEAACEWAKKPAEKTDGDEGPEFNG